MCVAIGVYNRDDSALIHKWREMMYGKIINLNPLYKDAMVEEEIMKSKKSHFLTTCVFFLWWKLKIVRKKVDCARGTVQTGYCLLVVLFMHGVLFYSRLLFTRDTVH